MAATNRHLIQKELCRQEAFGLWQIGYTEQSIANELSFNRSVPAPVVVGPHPGPERSARPPTLCIADRSTPELTVWHYPLDNPRQHRDVVWLYSYCFDVVSKKPDDNSRTGGEGGILTHPISVKFNYVNN